MLLSFRRTSVLLWIGLTKLTLYAAFRCMGSRNAIFLVKKLILLDLCVYCLTNLRPESLCCSAGFGYALNFWCITEAKTWYHQKLKGDVRESCNVDNISHLALQKEFLEKYGSFVQLVVRIYPNETVPSVIEMREALSNL
ncbi:hypothetical protein BHM03_00026413 [Ensete ventricosum]|nr:hypothetical protein BHM03_00026413 [Ensete ventricosum]